MCVGLCTFSRGLHVYVDAPVMARHLAWCCFPGDVCLIHWNRFLLDLGLIDPVTTALVLGLHTPATILDFRLLTCFVFMDAGDLARTVILEHTHQRKPATTWTWTHIHSLTKMTSETVLWFIFMASTASNSQDNKGDYMLSLVSNT